jgi:hypothetical protein
VSSQVFHQEGRNECLGILEGSAHSKTKEGAETPEK